VGRPGLDAAEVTFSGSTAVVRGQRVEGTTKGGRSRTISIDQATATLLREHQRQQAKERQAAGLVWSDSGLVFTTRWGEPLYPDAVTALMSKLIREHNKSVMPPGEPLPHARLHDLRHLHATTLLLAGVPVHVVASRLGHADPAVTLRIYSHVLREQTRRVGDVFAQAIDRAIKAPVSKSVSKPRRRK
jgi:integrase